MSATENITGPDPREDDPTPYEIEVTFKVEVKTTITTSNRESEVDIEEEGEEILRCLKQRFYQAEVIEHETEKL